MRSPVQHMQGTRCTIQSLTAEAFHVDFRHSFSHASATRSKTETLLVSARLEDGSIGWGESCPRSYVTGENLASANQFVTAVSATLIARIGNVDDLRDWTLQNRERIDRNPAAWCAIELALLDAFSRSQGKSVEDLLGLPSIHRQVFSYSAVLDNSSLPTFEAMLEAYLAVGISDFKMKLSGDLAADKSKVQLIQQMASDIRLRVDANNLWDDSREAIGFLQQLNMPLFGIEEPLQPGALGGMASIAESLDCKIILDESLLTLQDLEMLQPNLERWVVNLRVSKMGGLLRSISLLDRTAQLQIPVIVGAQVGETSLLTRAALTAARYAGPQLVAQEGAFSTLLLREDVFHPNLMFGTGGLLTADVPGSGFGLQRLASDTSGAS